MLERLDDRRDRLMGELRRTASAGMRPSRTSPPVREVLLATCVCEIAGAVALLTQRLRWLAGFMLALYAIAVFPANIKHAFENVPIAGVTLGWWYHAPRLALQPLLVWWALFCSGVIDRPWRTER